MRATPRTWPSMRFRRRISACLRGWTTVFASWQRAPASVSRRVVRDGAPAAAWNVPPRRADRVAAAGAVPAALGDFKSRPCDGRLELRGSRLGGVVADGGLPLLQGHLHLRHAGDG